jgi:hypothetical protein
VENLMMVERQVVIVKVAQDLSQNYRQNLKAVLNHCSLPMFVIKYVLTNAKKPPKPIVKVFLFTKVKKLYENQGGDR